LATWAGAESLRSTVATGKAISASGSLAATPTRTVPTSTPTRTPLSTRSHCVGDGRYGVGNLGGIRAATLGEVGLAATTATQDARCNLDEVARRQSQLPCRSIGRNNDAGAVSRREQCH